MTINLNTITTGQGLKFTSSGISFINGVSDSSAGDFNGDGIADIVLNLLVPSNTGSAYVVYGKSSGLADLNLATATASDALKIHDTSSSYGSGYSTVASAGDINNDGFDDLIFGQSEAISQDGRAFVVYGGNSYGAELDLASATLSQSFKIQAESENGRLGASVSGAGDINNDGFDDIIMGAPRADGKSGAAYVLLGNTTVSGDIDLSTLTSAQGFKIIGDSSIEGYLGNSVSGTGDINNDGFADMVVGAPNTPGDSIDSRAYVFYGNSGPFSDIDVTSLAHPTGVKISPNDEHRIGLHVTGLGNINNDDFADFAISAGGGTFDIGFPIYGGTGLTSNFALNTTSSDFFKIHTSEYLAYAAAAPINIVKLGDINNDGFDDIGISNQFYSSSGGGSPLINYAGAGYAIFGKSAAFADIDIQSLDSTTGVKLIGEAGSQAGYSMSAADINNDGFSDIIMGAPGTVLLGSGSSVPDVTYVVYGADYTPAPTISPTPAVPTTSPTASPTLEPTAMPSIMIGIPVGSPNPTPMPTISPTASPTLSPTTEDVANMTTTDATSPSDETSAVLSGSSHLDASMYAVAGALVSALVIDAFI